MCDLLFDRLNALGGWELKPDVIRRVMQSRPGNFGSIYEANPALRGLSQGKVTFLFRAFDDPKALGGQPQYRAQTIGDCVGRTGAMIGDEQAAILAAAGKIRWPGHSIAASVYGEARVEIGRDEHGARVGGEGAVVAYAVEAATRFGLLHEDLVQVDGQSYDLRGKFDDDELARQWGNQGVPKPLWPIAHHFFFQDFAPITTAEEAADAIAAGHSIWFGTSQAYWSGRLPACRDDRGFLPAMGSTGHSYHANGQIDDGEIRALVLDNKQWGDDWLTGPEGKYPIGAGRWLSTYDDFQRVIDRSGGDCYAVSRYAGFPILEDEINWITL
jgi:hypothetical protein